MRRLVMWNLVTLDGMFEGSKPWDIEWHDKVWGEELQAYSLEQESSAGMLLFGRTTYQGMASYWSNATGATAEFMNRIPKVVFSSTLEKAEWKNSTLVRGDAAARVRDLKKEEGKDLFVFGSAHLTASLMNEGLVDELRLGVVPIVLGAGTPLFKPGNRFELKLLESRPMKSGCVILRFALENDLKHGNL